MNLATIELAIYDRLNLSPNPGSGSQRMLRRMINDTYREVMGKKWLPMLRRNVLSFSTVANSPFAVLPQAVSKVFLVTDRTNMALLEQVSLQQIRYNDPGLQSSAANPYSFAVYNMSAAVSADPSAATNLTAVSDSASDGTGVTAYVEGITSDGQVLKASPQLNGTTPVAVGSVSTWIEIQKFYLSTPAQGHVSLKDSGSNTLSQISPGRQFARYTRLHLFPKPSSVLSLTADVELHIEDLTAAGDEPLIPEDFADILIHGALSKEYLRRDKPELAGGSLTIMRQRIAELQAFIARPSGTPFNQARPRRFSQLGANFPNGT